jgi:hypothetical protein
LAAFGAPKKPLHRNELLIWQKNWGVKHHAALLPPLGLGPALKHHTKGIATHGALLLVVKKHMASSP